MLPRKKHSEKSGLQKLDVCQKDHRSFNETMGIEQRQ
jgi:hypothetical protein